MTVILPMGVRLLWSQYLFFVFMLTLLSYLLNLESTFCLKQCQCDS